MFSAELYCSDPACGASYVAHAETEADLYRLSCRFCGNDLGVLAWGSPDAYAEGEEAVQLELQRGPFEAATLERLATGEVAVVGKPSL